MSNPLLLVSHIAKIHKDHREKNSKLLDFKNIKEIVPKFSNLYREPDLDVLWCTSKKLEKKLLEKAEEEELILTDGFGEWIKTNSLVLENFIKDTLISKLAVEKVEF